MRSAFVFFLLMSTTVRASDFYWSDLVNQSMPKLSYSQVKNASQSMHGIYGETLNAIQYKAKIKASELDRIAISYRVGMSSPSQSSLVPDSLEPSYTIGVKLCSEGLKNGKVVCQSNRVGKLNTNYLSYLDLALVPQTKSDLAFLDSTPYGYQGIALDHITVVFSLIRDSILRSPVEVAYSDRISFSDLVDAITNQRGQVYFYSFTPTNENKGESASLQIKLDLDREIGAP